MAELNGVPHIPAFHRNAKQLDLRLTAKDFQYTRALRYLATQTGGLSPLQYLRHMIVAEVGKLKLPFPLPEDK